MSNNNLLSHLSNIDDFGPIYANQGNSQVEDTLLDAPSEDATQEQINPDEPSNNEDLAGSGDNHDWKKRYSDIRSHLSKIEREKNDAIGQLQREIEALKKQPVQLPKTKQEIEEFKSIHADLYNTVYSMIKMELVDTDSDIKAEVERLKAREQAVEVERALQEIKKHHPDVLSIKDDPKFDEWLIAQSQGIKALIGSNDYRDIIKGLDLYKLDTKGKTKASISKKEEQKNDAMSIPSGGGSSAPSTGGKKIFSESQIEQMSAADFRKYEKEIESALKEGRFVFDRSKR